MTRTYENMFARDLSGNPIKSWAEGDRIVAMKGERAGQKGKLVEPLGVNISWVKWDRGNKGPAYSVYPFESMVLEKVVPPVSAKEARKRSFGPFE